MKLVHVTGQVGWQAAHRLVLAAGECAQARNARISAAIVDTGGHLLAFMRMNDVAFHTIALAQDKAATAAAFGLSTGQLRALLSKEEGAREVLSLQPHFVPLAGGVALISNGMIIGGIGISGGSAQEDDAIARSAILEMGFQCDAGE